VSTPRPLLVGIDVGTTLTKAGIVAVDGAEIAQASVPTPWTREATGGHVEPDRLFDSVAAVLAQVLAAAPDGDVVGVGVTSMAETVVLVDASGMPVAPAVAWYDVRAAAEHAELRRELGEGLGHTTGLGTSQIPTIATVRWLLGNGVRRASIASMLSVAEWVVARLGGEWASEPSLASRTGALAVATRSWWSDACLWSGLAPSTFPQLRQAATIFGRVGVAPNGCERLTGAVLTVAGHDHLCAAVGIGATHPDQAMDSCGTAEALVRAVPADPDRDLTSGLALGIEVGCHVLGGHDALIGGLSLGLDLTRVLAHLGVVDSQERAELDAKALALDLDHGAPLAESDDRAPVSALREISDLDERDGELSPELVWFRAVARAAARSRRLLDGLERLGGPVTEVRASGGWARNPVLARLKSATFPPTTYPSVSEAGIRGAALMSAVAAGLYPQVRALPDPRLAAPSVGGPMPVTPDRPSRTPSPVGVPRSTTYEGVSP
jgi:sugar (pentulose or hexulose) kinase